MWPFGKKRVPLMSAPFEIGEMVAHVDIGDLDGCVEAPDGAWEPDDGQVYVIAEMEPPKRGKSHWWVRLKEDPDPESWWDERCFEHLRRKTNAEWIESLATVAADKLIKEKA